MDKAFILAEIRRCAEANGGVALGQARFRNETGIRAADWSGKHWARWSDALAEAGYAGNKLNTAYSDELLLGQLAQLVRDLGRFPVRTEIRLRRRERPDFPSHNTYARYGTRQALVRALHDYCSANPELRDVQELCAAEEGSALPESVPAKSKTGRDVDDGYVYLVKSGKHYKVGRANDAGRRHYEIALQLPERLREVHVIRTDDPRGIERYWHERFAERRLNGEWFALTPADVAAFKRRSFM